VEATPPCGGKQEAALLAKHAQLVTLIHFPCMGGTLFDFVARVFPKPNFRGVAGWSFLFAAVRSIPSATKGILAWRWALEGQHLKGILRLLGWAAVFAVPGFGLRRKRVIPRRFWRPS